VQQTATARRMLPAGLTALGGLLLVVASFLPWVTFQVAYRGFAFTRSSSGLDTWAGRIVLGVGILAVVGGAAITMIGSSAARGLAVAAVALGIVAAALAAHDISTKDRAVNAVLQDRLSRVLGRPLTIQQIELVKRLAGVEVSLGTGIYLALGGGMLIVAGGFAMLSVREDEGDPDGPGPAGAGFGSPPPSTEALPPSTPPEAPREGSAPPL
jgi:hypothetical protein